MFQSFTGSTRRPRQVNLSGQNIDPFAASSWAPTASGTKKTIEVAQQERLQRQQERDRLSAAKLIQRTWRGHRSRAYTAAERRREWDQLKSVDATTEPQLLGLPQELRLLLAFFSVNHQGDIERLSHTIDRLLLERDLHDFFRSAPRTQICHLAHVILASLSNVASVQYHGTLLDALSCIVSLLPQIIPRIAQSYYIVLVSLLKEHDVLDLYRAKYLAAVCSPLQPSMPDQGRDNTLITAYKALALRFLSLPKLDETYDILKDLTKVVELQRLSEALVQLPTAAFDELSPNRRLWILAHLIAIRRLHGSAANDQHYMRALSALLSICVGDLVGRVDIGDETELLRESEDSDESAHYLGLPQFIQQQVVSLVNKESIIGLLANFDVNSPGSSSASQTSDSSSLASYALILLRIFPRLGEEIRMWLYQGSVGVAGSDTALPAVKLFWKAMNNTKTFKIICTDSKAALSILRSSSRHRPNSEQGETDNQDWRGILLFLELYAFVLRFTDDEEFLNGGAANIYDPGQIMSRSRQSALPLEDVKLLTMFLKNLSFTMFYNAAELSEAEASPSEGSLVNYFGTNSVPRFTDPKSVGKPSPIKKSEEPQTFLGIAGMTFLYVRGIVTRVLRMLYERDSRRPFLPKEHWLMTQRFDMEGFIPAVVAEEERRHQVTEDGENIEDDDEYYESTTSSLVGNLTSRRQMHFETLRRQQQRAARRKVLASVGPRLEVLQNMPFAIPFETRVQIFRQFVYQDQHRRRGGTVDPDHWRMTVMHGHGFDHRSGRDALSRHHAKIRRNNLFEDAFDQFYELGEGLKEPIQITFVDQFDAHEAGIDGGGVTKEFLTSVTKEAFETSEGAMLFVANDQNLLYPNPEAMDERRMLLRQSGIAESDPYWRESLNDLLKHYEFLGRVIGKCLYEGILVDISFAGFFLLKWATGGEGHESSYLANINDLRDLDEVLYQNLLKLKNDSGNISDYGIDFTVTDTVSIAGQPTQNITRELMPNGSNIPVTNDNRTLYVSFVANHRLHRRPFQQTRAFLKGLGEIINPTWLSMFNQAELQTLIGGDSSEIDVDDLRRNTQYSGVYEIGHDGLEHPTVQLFWGVMKELDDTERRKVLKYVTSTPRAPLLGFSQLNPRFSIRDAGVDEQRLPSTSTCINLMKLPRYSTSEVLRQKLLYAVNSGAGFDLS